MRRPLALVLTLVAIAIAAAGCGKSSSAKSPLDDALGYMPKSSRGVVAIKTDPSDAQFKNLSRLIDKFPFAGQIKSRFKEGISIKGRRIDYDKDIKPILGNDLVVAIPPGGAHGRHGNAFVLAWKTKKEGAKRLLSDSASRTGSSSGADVYRDGDGGFEAIEGDVLVAAQTRPLLDAALKARDANDRLTEDDFEANLGGLSKDALVRAEGDFQKIFAGDPRSAQARKVPWVNGLKSFGATLASKPDGIVVDFDVRTSGVTAAQLPLAAGADSPPVVKRPAEIGVALRDPAQVARFAEQVAGATDPKSLLSKDRVSKKLGVDVDRDVIAQLGGNSAASFALDGGYALRADVKNPGTFKRTLATIMRNLPKAQRSQGKPASSVRPGAGGLFTVTKPGHKPATIGVVGKELVIASDARRAKEFAAAPANPASSAKGALALQADIASIVSAQIKKRGGSAAALLFGGAIAGHFKDLSGSVESEPSGLRGHFQLVVR